LPLHPTLHVLERCGDITVTRNTSLPTVRARGFAPLQLASAVALVTIFAGGLIVTFLGEAISVPPNVLRPWPRCTAAAVLLACRRDVYIRVDSPDGEMMTRFSVPILGASANDEVPPRTSLVLCSCLRMLTTPSSRTNAH